MVLFSGEPWHYEHPDTSCDGTFLNAAGVRLMPGAVLLLHALALRLSSSMKELKRLSSQPWLAMHCCTTSSWPGSSAACSMLSVCSGNNKSLQRPHATSNTTPQEASNGLETVTEQAVGWPVAANARLMLADSKGCSCYSWARLTSGDAQCGGDFPSITSTEASLAN